MEQHIHPMYDDDVAHFHIDTDSRAISHTTAEKLVLIQGDHNSEIYTFDIPRFNDGHDMMLCNLVQIHFINIDANNSQNVSSGVYEVLDMQLDPLDPNTCICSWIISNEATPFVGRLTFALRFACMEGSRCTYVWNTQIFDGVPVQKSYNNSDLIMSEYTDILEKWYWEFVNTTTTGVNVIADAKDKAIAEIETVLFNRGGISVSETEPEDDRIAIWIKPSDPLGTIRIHNLDTDDFDPVTLDTIKGEKGDKGDQGEPGDPTTFIVQDIYGEADDKVPSQAALKTKFEEDSQSFYDIASRLESLEGNSVDSLQERLHNIESNIGDNLQERLESLEGNSVDSLQERLYSIEGNIGENLQERLESLEGNVGENLQERLYSIEGNIGENLQERLESIESDNSTIDTRYRDLSADLRTYKTNTNNKVGIIGSVIGINYTTTKSERLDAIETNIDEVEVNVNNSFERISSMEAEIGELTKDVRFLESLPGIDSSIYDSLDERMKVVEGINASQSSTIADISSNLSTISESINGSIETITNDIVDIKDKNTQQDEQINSVASNYLTLHSRVYSLEELTGLSDISLSEIYTRIIALESNVDMEDSNKNEIDELRGRINTLEPKVSSLESTVAAQQAVIDELITKVNRLIEG